MTRAFEGTRPRPGPPAPRRLSAAQGWRLTLIGGFLVLLGAVVGLLLAGLAPTRYVARTDIEYHLRIENASYFLRTDTNLTGQSVLLTDPAVLGPVAAAHGLSVDDLSKRVSATILDNSEIIQLDVQDPSRDNGVALADAIAAQYLTVQRSASPTVAIQRQLDDAQRALGTATAAELPAAQARVAVLQGQLDVENTSGNTADVLSPAYSVATPASPNRALGAGLGALCGALAAAVVVIALSRRWTRPGGAR